MSERENLIGRTFGRLVVLFRTERRQKYVCRCVCGNTTTVRGFDLISAKTRSCGCLRRDRNSDRLLVHGHSKTPNGGRATAEYTAWLNINQRTTNPRRDDFDRYGGAGITISPTWRGQDGFQRFLADVGARPSPHHSIDRIDGSRGYEPGNCRWATPLEQARNRHLVVLTEEKVTTLRAIYDAGFGTYEELATMLGVSKDAVANAASRRSWKDLPGGSKRVTRGAGARRYQHQVAAKDRVSG